MPVRRLPSEWIFSRQTVFLSNSVAVQAFHPTLSQNPTFEGIAVAVGLREHFESVRWMTCLSIRHLDDQLLYGVVPCSQTAVDPPPGVGIRVRRSSWIPEDVGANCIGRVQLWPTVMPARQVFCVVVRTV